MTVQSEQEFPIQVPAPEIIEYMLEGIRLALDPYKPPEVTHPQLERVKSVGERWLRAQDDPPDMLNRVAVKEGNLYEGPPGMQDELVFADGEVKLVTGVMWKDDKPPDGWRWADEKETEAYDRAAEERQSGQDTDA
jgi:hypothetical protein